MTRGRFMMWGACSIDALRIGAAVGLLCAHTPMLAQQSAGAFAQAQAPALPSGTASDFSRASALPALLEKARTLLRARNPRGAFALLEPRTGDYAGNEEFDYLLGISALDSGDPGRATIALERVLAVNPGNTLARAEIARAFLALKENEAAKRELESVARADLPAPVRETIDRYLAILAKSDAGERRRWNATVDIGLGYDDNVNLGSSLDRWVLGDGQALTPLPASRPRESTFHSIAGQVQYVAPIDGRTDWTIGAAGSRRINPSQHNTDLGSVEASGGLVTTRERDRYSVSIQVQQLWLDDSKFRSATGLLGQWQRELDRRSQAGLYAQWFALRFTDQGARDANRAVLGATYVRGFEDKAASVVIGNAYVGKESVTGNLDELSFDLLGFRAAASRQLAPKWRGSASASLEKRSYGAADSFFGKVRSDTQYEIRIGAEREIDKHLSITPQISLTRNASNLGPNDFSRTQIQLSARYRF